MSSGKTSNCQLYATSYLGAGKFGENGPNSITLPHKPFVVFLEAGTFLYAPLQGRRHLHRVGSTYLDITWSGNILSWYSSTALAQANENGIRYPVLALLEL